MKHSEVVGEGFGDWAGSKIKGVANRAAAKVTGGGLKANIQAKEAVRKDVEKLVKRWGEYKGRLQIKQATGGDVGDFLRSRNFPDKAIRRVSRADPKMKKDKPFDENGLRDFFTNLFADKAIQNMVQKQSGQGQIPDTKPRNKSTKGQDLSKSDKFLQAFANLPKDEKKSVFKHLQAMAN